MDSAPDIFMDVLMMVHHHVSSRANPRHFAQTGDGAFNFFVGGWDVDASIRGWDEHPGRVIVVALLYVFVHA